MPFKDDNQPETVFTNQKLLHITLTDIERWFKLLAFDTMDPGKNN
jgi:hypothetical protein